MSGTSNHPRTTTTDPPQPSLTSCPPIFVLSTHLSLEELHNVEENLELRGASLTYDPSEARLVLGRVQQKKRAALELRAHGVWTEEVHPSSTLSDYEPPEKRRRVDSKTRRDLIDLASEGRRSPSPDGLSVASGPSVTSTVSSDGAVDVIKVVRLEWLDKSIVSGRLLPVDPFVVYQARITERPEEFEHHHEDSRSRRTPVAVVGGQILQRAKADAALQPSAAVSSNRLFSRRTKEQDHGQRQPPKLHRQTTSENDEAILTSPAPDWVKNHVKYACMRSTPLHPPNETFINQLSRIRRIRELTLDEIGVRAYSTSIAAIAAYPYELRTTKEVLSLPGCDMKIANLFAEFRDSPNGILSAAKVLDTDPTLKTLNQFYSIWGVGAKTARDFYYFRHWRDLDDIVEYGWNTLSRVQQIGVKYYDEFKEGVPRKEVEEIARTVHRHANLVRPDSSYDGRGVECIIVGGYRRGKEVSGDVDLVLSHRDESVTKNLVVDIVGSLEAEGWITHTLALHMTSSNREQQTLPFQGGGSRKHFDTLDKALVVWQDPRFNDDDDGEEEEEEEEEQKESQQGSPKRKQPKRNPNPHRRVDIIISPWRTVGCAVLGWSGDMTFERDLRRYTKKVHGWKFDSSGVRERRSGGRVIDLEGPGRTWKERERLVMEGLGVGWRDPTERCSR